MMRVSHSRSSASTFLRLFTEYPLSISRSRDNQKKKSLLLFLLSLGAGDFSDDPVSSCLLCAEIVRRINPEEETKLGLDL